MHRLRSGVSALLHCTLLLLCIIAHIYRRFSWHIILLCLLQNILLSDDTTDSDTDSDDSDFCLSREELHDMLRLHRFTRQHQSKFHSDREVRSLTHEHNSQEWLEHLWFCNVIIVNFPAASPISVLQHRTPVHSWPLLWAASPSTGPKEEENQRWEEI